ncbi:VacJ family lipoprotein [Psychromonas sp. 14N.309.X.WAT.B.A12]|uniref:MlaA family lipoprotein n=1 Tax=unclassified Psychromonas TaxID=2614957 RepID=UPI0025B0BDF4|nr:VacJ family lipoprotein [Psychromonas sp. 14N.309.X.WAT.B.A12]MDN2662871.1 VacJ family lipoprotein [Psychromonas sp. 14N.309.X.WAT.B.A12]
MFIRILLPTLLLMVSSSAFAQSVQGNKETYMSDPIEPVNRLVWDFNYYVLDDYIYRPVTESYVDWVPKAGREAINNAVQNLEEPSTIVNNLLQLEFQHATDAFFRFAFNSTFGVFGLFDVAKYGGVERRRESFSNVLGNWYVPQGPYLMVPVTGPSSARIVVGSIVDNLYFPTTYFTWWQTATIWIFDGLDARSSALGQEVLVEQSLDSYTFVKEAYIQSRINALHKDSNEFFELKQQSADKQVQEQADLSDFLDEID